MSRTLQSTLLNALVGAALALSLAVPAHAGFIASMTGNSTMKDPSDGFGDHVDGIVSFAVYENLAGNWKTDLGIGGSVVDLDGAATTGSERYVYFYQLASLPTTPHPLGRALVTDVFDAFDGVGYLSDTVFRDALGLVGPAANRTIGSEFALDDVVNGTPSESGAALGSPPFAADAASVNPLLGDLDVGMFSAVTFNTAGPFGEGKIPAGRYSSVYFMTSSFPPMYAHGQIENGSPDFRSDGDVPSATPEPGALVLAALGAALLAAGSLRRRVAR